MSRGASRLQARIRPGRRRYRPDGVGGIWTDGQDRGRAAGWLCDQHGGDERGTLARRGRYFCAPRAAWYTANPKPSVR